MSFPIPPSLPSTSQIETFYNTEPLEAAHTRSLSSHCRAGTPAEESGDTMQVAAPAMAARPDLSSGQSTHLGLFHCLPSRPPGCSMRCWPPVPAPHGQSGADWPLVAQPFPLLRGRGLQPSLTAQQPGGHVPLSVVQSAHQGRAPWPFRVGSRFMGACPEGCSRRDSEPACTSVRVGR